MSVIVTTTPLGSEPFSLGASRLRETRTWLQDLWTAFIVGFREGTVAGDPGTSSGLFRVPTIAPAVPAVGHFYVNTDGVLFNYKTGPTSQVGGDLEVGAIACFYQSAAPTGWSRNASLQDQSLLRYVTGAPSSGGTGNVTTAFTHGNATAPAWNLSGGSTGVSFTSDHAVFHYTDVIMATR